MKERRNSFSEDNLSANGSVRSTKLLIYRSTSITIDSKNYFTNHNEILLVIV